MGSLMSKEKKMRVVILGADAAGKTTVLYQIKSGMKKETVPTIGFNMETVRIKNRKLTLWDIGGQDKLREYWKNYLSNVSILVYVVDASDSERIEEARDALFFVLSNPGLDDCVLLVYANKQDMKNAIDTTDLTDRLGLNSIRNKRWLIQPSCATTGEGVMIGLQRAILETKKTKSKEGGFKGQVTQLASNQITRLTSLRL